MKQLIFLVLILLGNTSFFQAQNWITDFETAKSIAKTEHKSIVLVFQGSDWCAPCIKLEKEILSTATFQEYANEHFVMLQADFPRRKNNKLSEQQQAHNNALAETYNKNGFFPYVVVMDAEGHMKGSTGYKKISPAEYVKLLESFN